MMSRKFLKAVKAVVLCLAVSGALSVIPLAGQTDGVDAHVANASCAILNPASGIATSKMSGVNDPCSETSSSSGSFWIPYSTYPVKKGDGGKYHSRPAAFP
jgi:hypothetical protein